MAKVKVYVVKRERQQNLQLKWRDPRTRKTRWKSANTNVHREAVRAAARLEREIELNAYCDPSKTTWADFRVRYEGEVANGLAEHTARKIDTTFDLIERVINPTMLVEMDSAAIGKITKHLRTCGRAEATIKGYLAYIQAALNWACEAGILDEAPTIKQPKRAKKSKMMKGRPVTGEEFDRMLEKVPDVVSERRAESWKFLLRGLWWSGLRISEAVNLHWDSDDALSVDFTGKRPMLKIRAEHEKGNQDRLLPMAPEFAELLETVPNDQRTGRVFRPESHVKKTVYLNVDAVGRTVAKIGETANVIVERKPGKIKYASAHDLRRSFGERWAARIMPQILMVLMRHENIETTMKYYVGRNAETAADAIWEARFGGKVGGNADSTEKPGIANAENH